MSKITSWREHFANKIAAIIRQYPNDCPVRRQALKDAWDAGPRAYHPYKVYLDEIARQTGKKPSRRAKRNDDNPGQGSLV
jgi:hypothetical protein